MLQSKMRKNRKMTKEEENERENEGRERDPVI